MNTFALLLRVGAVFVLLLGVLWLVRRSGAGALRRTGPMQVLGSTKLGKTSSLTLVRIGDQTYALGVTDRNVTLLTETAPMELPTAEDAAGAPAVPGAVAELRSLGARLMVGLRGSAAAAAPEATGSDTATATGTDALPEIAPARRTTPPTTAEFARDLAGRFSAAVAARRASRTLDLTDDALALAATAAPGPDAPGSADFDLLLAGALGLTTPVVDGSTTTAVARTPRARQHARTDAPSRRDEDDPWTTRCRQPRGPRTRGSQVY